MTSSQPVPSEIPSPKRSNGSGIVPDNALVQELQAARRNEAILRDFIETSTISLHWVGADGTILWANQAELDLLGYSRDEYIGRNIVEFHADQPVISDILACLSRGETLRDYRARLRHRDGSIRHVLINSSVFFEDGKFIHTRCFTRDVTALIQEQEAREEQRRLNALAARVGRHLIESGTLGDMLRNCTEAVTQELGGAIGCIWALNVEENVLELQASSGPSIELDGQYARIPVGNQGIGQIAAQGQPFSTNQAVGNPNLLEQDWVREQGITGFAGYPLIVEERIVGVMSIFSRQFLSDVTLRGMARLADQIASGIERKNIETVLSARETQLAAELADTRLLREISAQLIEPGDEEALYAKIVDAVAVIMRSDFATMQILSNEPQGELRLLASRGLTPEGMKLWEWVRPDTESTCGQALRTGKRAIASNVETCDFLAGTGGMAALLDAGIRPHSRRRCSRAAERCWA